MARIIAVALPKGGVGKTTTAVNLAAGFAIAGHRTLLIDMDTFGASALALGFTEGTIKAGLYEVFNFITGIQSAIHRTDIEHLDFIPSNVQNLQMEDRMTRVADNRAVLRNSLRGVASQYAFIVLDCPPVLRGLCANALHAADSVLIPVRAGHFALDAVDRLFKYIDYVREVGNKALDIEGILLTMHEPNTKVADISMRELDGKYHKYLLSTSIPRNSAVSEASFYGKPAVTYNSSSRGSIAYMTLAREIAARHSHSTSTPLATGALALGSQQ
jgi:chromosome partitioning protein